MADDILEDIPDEIPEDTIKDEPAPRPDKGGSYRAEGGRLVQSRPPTKSKEG